MSIRVVHFYKMVHVQRQNGPPDPRPVSNGRIWFGVCMPKLRACIERVDTERRDNLVIAIGGKTAKDGLRDRLAWGGVPVEKQPGDVLELEGFYLAHLGERAPRDWRQKFPLVAKYVDTVEKGHRNKNIPEDVREEFIRLFKWGRQIAPRMPAAFAPTEGSPVRCVRRCGPRSMPRKKSSC
jgi:hypothetical protein